MHALALAVLGAVAAYCLWEAHIIDQNAFVTIALPAAAICAIWGLVSKAIDRI